MPKLPDPPAAAVLAAIPPAIATVPTSAQLYRIYFQAGAHPTTWDAFRTWGPTGSRFDPHEPPPCVQPDRAVLYAAGDLATCLAEVYQDFRVVNRVRGAPSLVGFHPSRPLRLLDLTGTWITRVGASGAIATGPRDRARRWARALHAAYPDVDGLLYRSSMNGAGLCKALWAGARAAVPGAPSLHRRLDDPVLHDTLRVTCAKIGYALI